ncbi:MAG TPA: hypothetical protein VF984_02190 [Actinomycetota bacterium]
MAESWFDVRFSPTGGWWIAQEFESREEAEEAFPDLSNLAHEEDDPEFYVARQILLESRMDPEQRAALAAFREEQIELLQRKQAVLTDEIRRRSEEIQRLRE